MQLYTQTLEIRKDEATGEFGFCSKNCQRFNTSWQTLMIFHDVFEHWMEYNHPYFQNDFGENVIGEMVAMGAMWWFYDGMGLYRRLRSTYKAPGTMMRETTESMILDRVSYGGWNEYGDTLESCIPYQRPTENEELEYQIKKFWENVKNAPLCVDEKEAAKYYKDSVTFSKIANAHRYGYNLAKKMFPNNRHNFNLLNDFWDYWDKFFKWDIDKENYQNIDFEFVISKNSGKVNWKLYINNKKVSTKNPIHLEDFFYQNEEAYY